MMKLWGSSARLIELPGRQKQQRVLFVLFCVGCDWCHDVGTEMTSEDEMRVYCQDIPKEFFDKIDDERKLERANFRIGKEAN